MIPGVEPVRLPLPAIPAVAMIAGLVLFAALVASPLAAQEADPIPRLTVSGEGSIDVVPDIAIVTLGVVSRAPTAGEALRANSVDLADVIATVLATGVAERDVGTTSFSISPVYQRRRDADDNSPPKIVGYSVSNQIRVVIRDLAESGELLDKVVQAGANQVNGLSFDIDDRQGAADAALADAIGDARRKAEIMAEAAGVRLVRILSISTQGGRPAPVFERAMTMAADAAVPVMPGERQVTTHASVTWEIAPQ